MSALLRITEGFVIKILGNESSSVEVVTDFVLTAFWAVFFGAGKFCAAILAMPVRATFKISINVLLYMPAMLWQL